MDIKWLKDFLVLSSEGNFRTSAHLRNVSQPAFSRRIQALEAWVGVKLIDRVGRPSQLTEAGELFHPIAQKIVDIAEAGQAEIQAHALKKSEKMRFATLSTLSQVFIPAWLKNLQPHISTTQFVIKTQYLTIAEYFAALDENCVDFFISYLNPKTGLLNDPSLFASLKIGKESFIPVVSPKKDGSPRWWLPDRPQGTIPCLHTHSDQSPWPIKNHMENKYSDLAFESVYDSTGGTSLKAMAIQGFGLAWLPRALVADSLKNGQLVRADKLANDIIVDIRIYRSLKLREARVDEFWQALVKQEKQSV
ncbi:MAG: LysR family transcriptional regulator [Devosiaceae bacterium]|nr:LysR family transcriptional regulator [Devosiaceae bacterium]